MYYFEQHRILMCAAGMDIGVASWLDSGGSSSKVSALQLNTAVAGEIIEVLISLGNPLAVDLQISRLRLMFEAEPMPTEAADLQHYADVCFPYSTLPNAIL